MAGQQHMDFCYDESGSYIRTLNHAQEIIKNAKLDPKILTPVTQALYYPSDSASLDNIKLLQLDTHLMEQIREGGTIVFKGGLNEKAVICTDSRTYDIKEAEISNSIMLLPDLKFAAATNPSPLKSPRVECNKVVQCRLNDTTDDDDELPVQRSLEHLKVLKVFHDYIECREIQPRFRKMIDLLQLTPYSGPENEDYVDRKLLFTKEQLLDTIQCSQQQFAVGLQTIRALEFNGYMRICECEYEFRIINMMVSLIGENSWPLDEIELEETLQALEGIAPNEIINGLFHIYTIQTEGKEGKWTYQEELVARIIARNILKPGLKFRMDDFITTWQDAMPERMICNNSYLRGLGIFDTEGNTFCVRSLNVEGLPTNVHERMAALFKTKAKWTLEEIEPYINCFASPTLTVSQFLAKFARSLTQNGTRYYLSKH